MSAGVMRPARGDDRFGVVRLARDFHAASGVRLPFCAAHASTAAQAFIESSDCLCLVYDVGGALRGVLAAQAIPSPLTPGLIAQELIFWVDPGHRGAIARRMIAGFEDWARAHGCVAAGLSALGDRRVARLFGFAGFDPVESSFLKILGGS